mmetsp:Transcript_38408/g.68684  ORF Transcript_38408/g.68684 Transcript_38408/m.68684 type:complete len:502 (-) Transcript_38408:1731-3236(-)
MAMPGDVPLASLLAFQALLELVELVLQLPNLLIREGLLLLAVLDLLLDVLDGLLLVLLSHGHALLDLDLVTRAIENLIGALAGIRVILGSVDRLSLNAQAALLHDPLLGRDIVAELLVVRDDQDTPLVVLDGEDQSTKAVAVEVVGRLIQNENVRVLPHGGCQHNLHLHATAQLVDLRVAGGLRVDAKVAQVLLHTRLSELLGHQPCHGSLTLVLPLHKLDVPHLHQRVLLDPDVVLHGLELPLHLVLECLLLLLLTSVHDGIGDDCTRLVLLCLLGILLGIRTSAHVTCDTVDAPLLGTSLFLVHREVIGLELKTLTVIVSGETPHDVLGGCLLHVLLQVVEGVLGHVGHSQALGLPDATLCGKLLAHQDLDGCGLASTVRTNHCHSAHLGYRQAHVHDGGLILRWVGKAHVVHAQDHLAAAFHTLQGSRLREDEAHAVVSDLEVGLLLRVLLDELGQRLALDTLEGFQLPVLEVNDVGAHLVQEGAEVGSADDASGEGL